MKELEEIKSKFQRIFVKELEKHKFNSILDVGCGAGEIAEYFLSKGKQVSSTTLCPEFYNTHKNINPVICDIEDLEKNFGKDSFEVVWFWNVLEHVPNVKNALKNIRSVLKPDGYLMVSVPSFTNYVDGGHLSDGWTIGHLMYVLLINGFDIKSGKFFKGHRQIVGLVKKGKIPTEYLNSGKGDIDTLKDYFPIDVFDGFNGNIRSVNWNLKYRDDFYFYLSKIYTYIKRSYFKRW